MDRITHKSVSFLKSGIRIVGFCALPWWPAPAALLLILAEVLGIAEEVVDYE